MLSRRFTDRPNPIGFAFSAAVMLLGLRADGQALVEYPIPTADGHPSSIAAGPDGRLWFTELDASRIGRISTDGDVVEFSTPTPASGPREIAAGPDGNLWFTEILADRIGRITTGGTVTEFPLASGSKPLGIAAGPDGNVWFTEWQGNRIGRISPDGTVSEFSLPGPPIRGPNEIVAGPDGALWFAEGFTFGIGRITTSGSLREYAAPDNERYPFAIAAGADGNLWVTDVPGAGGSIFRFQTDGTSSDFLLPPYAPSGIAAGPDGNLWFTLSDGHIGRITPLGRISLVTLPTSGTLPEGIAAGPDGRIWFTEPGTGRIGRLDPSATCDEPPAPELRINGVTSDSANVGGSYTLSWTSALGGSGGGYEIQISANNFGGFHSFAHTAVTTYSATVDPSQAGEALQFRVEAQHDCGLSESDSPPSNTVSLTVASDCSPPGRPQLLVDGRSSVSVAAGEAFSLSWSDVLGGQSGSYRVLRSTDGGQSYATFRDTSARELDVSTAPADSGKSWRFEVIARASCGGATVPGTASAPVAVSVAAPPPAGCTPGSGRAPCVSPIVPPPPIGIDGRNM